MSNIDKNSSELDGSHVLGTVLSQVDSLILIEDSKLREKRTEEYINNRLSLLIEDSTPQDISALSNAIPGFIHPQSRVYGVIGANPFVVDDVDIYSLMLNTVSKFKEKESWNSRNIEEIVPYAIQQTIGTYFGNIVTNDPIEASNRTFHLNRSDIIRDIHLKEMKGMGIASSAEKAAVAQNLLSFLGYKSELIVSSNNPYKPEFKDFNFYMYNIVSNRGGYLIYDPNHPVLVKRNSKDIAYVIPASHPITLSDRELLFKGKQIIIEHSDYLIQNGNYVKDRPTRSFYSGPIGSKSD